MFLLLLSNVSVLFWGIFLFNIAIKCLFCFSFFLFYFSFRQCCNLLNIYLSLQSCSFFYTDNADAVCSRREGYNKSLVRIRISKIRKLRLWVKINMHMKNHHNSSTTSLWNGIYLCPAKRTPNSPNWDASSLSPLKMFILFSSTSVSLF